MSAPIVINLSLAAASKGGDALIRDFNKGLAASVGSEVNAANLIAGLPAIIQLLGAVSVAARSQEFSNISIKPAVFPQDEERLTSSLAKTTYNGQSMFPTLESLFSQAEGWLSEMPSHTEQIMAAIYDNEIQQSEFRGWLKDCVRLYENATRSLETVADPLAEWIKQISDIIAALQKTDNSLKQQATDLPSQTSVIMSNSGKLNLSTALNKCNQTSARIEKLSQDIKNNQKTMSDSPAKDLASIHDLLDRLLSKAQAAESDLSLMKTRCEDMADLANSVSSWDQRREPIEQYRDRLFVSSITIAANARAVQRILRLYLEVSQEIVVEGIRIIDRNYQRYPSDMKAYEVRDFLSEISEFMAKGSEKGISMLSENNNTQKQKLQELIEKYKR